MTYTLETLEAPRALYRMPEADQRYLFARTMANHYHREADAWQGLIDRLDRLAHLHRVDRGDEYRTVFAFRRFVGHRVAGTRQRRSTRRVRRATTRGPDDGPQPPSPPLGGNT